MVEAKVNKELEYKCINSDIMFGKIKAGYL
jgi:hypothetical protein